MTQRLFIPDALEADTAITLSGPPAHYLMNVLRLSAGAPILLFNGRDGEWAATLETASKKAAVARVVQQTRRQETVPDMTLLFAPVKGDRVDGIVEKATELGARAICPVITARTIVRKVNAERLAARAVEAAEQTGRLCVPEIHEALSLDQALDRWDADRVLVFADEAGSGDPTIWGDVASRAQPMFEALHELTPRPTKVALLIGPEGGFSPEERKRLRGEPFVLAVTLGPRILRTDTAVFAGLSLIQAATGDWRA
jgi:16S rRNA (uracil1498-N3)-methyltransferase